MKKIILCILMLFSQATVHPWIREWYNSTQSKLSIVANRIKNNKVKVGLAVYLGFLVISDSLLNTPKHANIWKIYLDLIRKKVLKNESLWLDAVLAGYGAIVVGMAAMFMVDTMLPLPVPAVPIVDDSLKPASHS